MCFSAIFQKSLTFFGGTRMNEDKIKWCCRQAKGIRLIELKPHLSSSYAKEADETLENVFTSKGKWKTITAYYACYNALYAIFMKCGIKSEIHDCTLEMMELFDFDNESISFLKKLKEDRIQAQYYLKEALLENESEVKEFVSECKTILSKMNSDDIEKTRAKVK